MRAVDRILAPLTWTAAALVAVLLFAGPSLIGAEKEPAAAEPAPAGRAVFTSAGCGGCHTLKAAGATGVAGPNLDETKPDAARVRAIVANGGGAMPAFGGDLSAEEIAAVAEFVAAGAGAGG